MQKSDFLTKAESCGDFYLYYRKDGSKSTTYLVGTLDLSTPYIQKQILPGQDDPSKLKANEVFLWSWSSNKLRKIDLAKVKRVSPLGAVLKNTRE